MIQNFSNIGNDIMTIGLMIANNEELCKLLANNSQDCLTENIIPTKEEMLEKYIRFTPNIEYGNEDFSFIYILLDNFTLTDSIQFKDNTIQFDIICPFKSWMINDEAVFRPFKIMQILDSMFGESKLNGIGKIKFVFAKSIIVSENLGGYSLGYQGCDFS